jgi:hypothetical protein
MVHYLMRFVDTRVTGIFWDVGDTPGIPSRQGGILWGVGPLSMKSTPAPHVHERVLPTKNRPVRAK